MARTKVVSWLRAATLTFPAAWPVVLRVRVSARYSGGAAPASHRFPWLPSAIDCLAKLSTSKCARKRENHRASQRDRECYHKAWIDGAPGRPRGKIDDRHRIRRNVGCEESAKPAPFDRHRIYFFHVGRDGGPAFVFEQDFIHIGAPFEWKAERE